jgi:tartronate-semialdehyde synthase
MADGYSRAADGNTGICIGTSCPAGTDMTTGLYAAWADSIPMLCITGQAPVAKLHKEDFQAVDIESIAKPVTKMAMTVLEPGQVPGARLLDADGGELPPVGAALPRLARIDFSGLDA